MSCRIVKVSSRNTQKGPKAWLNILAQHLAKNEGIICSELVGDFIQTDRSTWYCLQIKAFRMEGERIRPKLRGGKVKRRNSISSNVSDYNNNDDSNTNKHLINKTVDELDKISMKLERPWLAK